MVIKAIAYKLQLFLLYRSVDYKAIRTVLQSAVDHLRT